MAIAIQATTQATAGHDLAVFCVATMIIEPNATHHRRSMRALGHIPTSVARWAPLAAEARRKVASTSQGKYLTMIVATSHARRTRTFVENRLVARKVLDREANSGGIRPRMMQ